jgi:CHC2 zinc finger
MTQTASTSDVHAALAELDSSVVSNDEFEARRQKSYLATFKPERRSVTETELALECLFDLGGFGAEAREGFHVLLAQFGAVKQADASPDEPVSISEVEAGRHLPGERGVTKASLRKRWVRRCQLMDEEQRRAGRLLFKRGNGEVILSRKRDGSQRLHRTVDKKIAPTYTLQLAQAVAEVKSLALKLRRGKRRERFRSAALAVWENLPECAPLEAEVKESRPKAEQRAVPLTGDSTRAVRRLVAAAEQIIEEGQEAGLDFETAALRVQQHIQDAIDLKRGYCWLSTISTSNTTLEAKNIVDSGDPDLVRAATDPEGRIPRENEGFGPADVDTGVHVRRPGLIPEDFKEEVRRRADIVEIVSGRVKLKRVGPEWKGCCPFHKEKTPSFSVNQAKGTYYCFGCQSGGDVFKFVRESEGVGFRDAVMIVAGSVGMSLSGVDVDRPPPHPRELVVEYEPGECVGPEWGDVGGEDFTL